MKVDNKLKILFFTLGHEITEEARNAAKNLGAFIRNGSVHSPGDTLEMADEVHGAYPLAYKDVKGVKCVGDGYEAVYGSTYARDLKIPEGNAETGPAGTVVGPNVLRGGEVVGSQAAIVDGDGSQVSVDTVDENARQARASSEVKPAETVHTGDEPNVKPATPPAEKVADKGADDKGEKTKSKTK